MSLLHLHKLKKKKYQKSLMEVDKFKAYLVLNYQQLRTKLYADSDTNVSLDKLPYFPVK